jgi:hypothetical protein
MDDLLKLIQLAKENGLKSVTYQGISLEFNDAPPKGRDAVVNSSPEAIPVSALPKEEVMPSDEELLFLASDFIPTALAKDSTAQS